MDKFIFIAILCRAILSEGYYRPNIITILIDDLGWNDVGFHGSNQIKTPNIDVLAYSGMILNRHYVLPTCTPSRSAFLTGYHPIHVGLQGYPLRAGENRALPLNFKLSAEYMKGLGYETHLVGKWHLGYPTWAHVPNRRGFDSFFGYYNGYVDYFKFGQNQTLDGNGTHMYYYGYDLHMNDSPHWTDMETYATTVFTKRAAEIIANHDASKPLYLYFAHLGVHTGHDDIGMEVPRSSNVDKTYDYIKDPERRAFAGCLEEVDKSVGVIMKALQDKGMLDNSIVLVMSDNGAHTVSSDMPPNWGSNWPLAGVKFTMYEGGVRGAALIWSPLLPKGVVNEGFIHISDWLPTLYSAAECWGTEYLNLVTRFELLGGDSATLLLMDGIDQWEALQNTSAVKRDHFLLNIDDASGAEGIIINNRWKILKGGLLSYGNYDYHWGKDENEKPNPEYDWNGVLTSETGQIIRKMPQFDSILNLKNMAKMRLESAVKCPNVKPDTARIPLNEGYVPPSHDFRCQNYCLFDIINDPCESAPIENFHLLKLAEALLNEIRETVVPQKPTFVEPGSNPEYHGGVWTPWESSGTTKSYKFHLLICATVFSYLLMGRRT